MNREALKRELTEEFQQSLEEAIKAVEQAPDGRWIAASEWQIREIFQRLMSQAYQRLLQEKVQAAEKAAFSPSGAVRGAEAVQQGAAGHRVADGRG